MNKLRQAKLDQLVNDIAESMDITHWRIKDFVDCINYQQDQIMLLHRELTKLKDATIQDRYDKLFGVPFSKGLI